MLLFKICQSTGCNARVNKIIFAFLPVKVLGFSMKYVTCSPNEDSDQTQRNFALLAIQKCARGKSDKAAPASVQADLNHRSAHMSESTFSGITPHMHKF